jgi:phenylpropionate dioxygenase-like ring-hydroxylating dioxygenase large terminal subunit
MSNTGETGTKAPNTTSPLPSSRVSKDRYTTRKWADLERERLWSRVWQLVCREEDVPHVGDFFEYEIGDKSVLIVRPSRRTLKAYFNSCLHRGTQLKAGCGNASELRCPFHGWCWALDGTNVEVIDAADFPGIDPAQLRLPECRVQTWGGFVFVNLDPNASSLESFVSPIVDQLAPYRLGDMRCMSWRTVKLPANWKTAIEAFNETYHLFGTHPDSIVANDDVNTKYDLFPPHGRMVTPIGIPSPRLELREGPKVTSEMVASLLAIQKVTPDQLAYMKLLRKGEIELPDGVTVQDVFAQMSRARLTKRGYGDPRLTSQQYGENWNYYLFPNICFNVLPGEFYGFRARPAGDDPNWCWFDVISLRFPEPGHAYEGHEVVLWSDEEGERESTWGHIVNQDFTNLPRIQRGLRAGGLSHVHFSRYQESRLALMHRELERYLFDGADGSGS